MLLLARGHAEGACWTVAIVPMFEQSVHLTPTMQIAVTAGSGRPPAGDAIAAAEAGEARGQGRGSRKGGQVAAEERKVQFAHA